MLRLSAACALAITCAGSAALAETPQFTPTGQFITPAAAPGAIFQPLNPGIADDPSYTAGQASAVALSPDGRTLLILTSGFNRAYAPDGQLRPSLSQEYVFVYDVSGAKPVQRQVVLIPNTFLGLAWGPAGDKFYVSGGVDDVVREYARGVDGFAAARVFKLGHHAGLGLAVGPMAGALAVSPDGRRLIVANFQNDSVSVIDLTDNAVREQDLRPGVIDPAKPGTPGGSFPRAVAWTSPTRAWVASQRDREVIAIDISDALIKVGARIGVHGQPVAFAGGGPRLYVALDNDDKVAVIDTDSERLVDEFRAALGPAAPPAIAALGGAGMNGLALSGDGRTLYASNGGANDVSVIRLSDRPGGARVLGLIPTGWYPTALAVQPGGRQLYVVNGKSPAGANPGNCRVNTGI
ncbi:MAG TPA: beta-propeller fold lactonase family protein, partial [Caulobacteraceae bacterium]|nr:beta-propeller fold lactonase family protein [Caulobacteraceae bacterium]